MRKNPERLAWIILLASFFTCLALAAAVPLGIRQYVLHARRGQNVSLEVQRGTLRVTLAGRGEPVAIAEERGDIPENTVVATDATSGRLLVRVPQASEQVITTVQIYGNTEVVLVLARSPRFAASSLPHQVILHVATGRVRVNVSDEGERPTTVEVRTPHGTLALAEGTYEVEVNATGEFTVHYGRATLSAGQSPVTLNSDERAIAGPEGVTGPLPAAPDLITNGDFQYPLENGWASETQEDEEPPGAVDIITHEGRQVASFARSGSSHSEVRIHQEINREVHTFASLKLHLAVYVQAQDVPVCGTWGSECPIMVRIDYVDANDQDQIWLQGFYTRPDPTSANPPLCTACGSPSRSEHIRVRQETWYSYLSPNLIPLLSYDLEPPAEIKSITIYASGHSYQAMVTEVELVGEQ